MNRREPLAHRSRGEWPIRSPGQTLATRAHHMMRKTRYTNITDSAMPALSKRFRTVSGSRLALALVVHDADRGRISCQGSVAYRISTDQAHPSLRAYVSGGRRSACRIANRCCQRMSVGDLKCQFHADLAGSFVCAANASHRFLRRYRIGTRYPRDSPTRSSRQFRAGTAIQWFVVRWDKMSRRERTMSK